jgi:hypothetical protein
LSDILGKGQNYKNRNIEIQKEHQKSINESEHQKSINESEHQKSINESEHQKSIKSIKSITTLKIYQSIRTTATTYGSVSQTGGRQIFIKGCQSPLSCHFTFDSLKFVTF